MSNPSIDPSVAVLGGVIYVVILVAVYVWIGLALSRVFQKSGVEGWKAWVPILNTIVLLQLGGYSGWFVLLGLVPIANIVLVVVLIISYHRINVSFGHGAGMTVLAALLFPVWATILGFGSSRWVGRETPAPSGPVRSGLPHDPTAFSAGARPAGAPGAYPPIAPPPGYGAPRPSGAPGFAAPVGPPPQGTGPIPPAPSGWMPQPPRAYGAPTAPPAGQGAAPVSGPQATPASFPPPPAVPAPPVVPAPVAPAAPPAPASASHDEASTPAPPALPPVAPDDDAPGPLRTRRSAPDAADDDDLGLPAAPEPREDPSAWSAPADAHEMTDAVTAAEPGAPGPIAAVPRAAAPDTSVPPLPPVTRVPARVETAGREPWAPALSPTPEGDAFPETSGPVSAIAGAPDAGSPRSARASVSALHTRPHVPDDDGENLDETVVTRRKRTPWTLVPASGRSVPVTADVLILGRRPVGDPAYPHAQLIAIDDDTRTVSKTHARVELRDGHWFIVDLDSTNGVLLTDAAGAEVEATAGVEAEAGERFLLGDAEIRLERSDA